MVEHIAQRNILRADPTFEQDGFDPSSLGLPKKGILMRPSPKEADFFLTSLRKDKDKFSYADSSEEVYLLFPLSRDLLSLETSFSARFLGFSAFSGPLFFSKSGTYRPWNSSKVFEIGTLKDLARIEGIQEQGNSFSFEVVVKSAHKRLKQQGRKRYFDRLRMYLLRSKEIGRRFRSKKAIEQLIPRYQLLLLKRPAKQVLPKSVGHNKRKTKVTQKNEVHPLPGQTTRAAQRMPRGKEDSYARFRNDDATVADPVDMAAK